MKPWQFYGVVLPLGLAAATGLMVAGNVAQGAFDRWVGHTRLVPFPIIASFAAVSGLSGYLLVLWSRVLDPDWRRILDLEDEP